MTIQIINPATEQLVREYEEYDQATIAQRLQSAESAYEKWRRQPVDERSAIVRRAGDVLRDRSAELARLMTEEMGKPITQARSEVEKCAWVCDYYAENGASFLSPQSRSTDASESYVRFDPLGPVLAVMPWNFPFWQVFRFAAPALTAGNVGLLKHAANVSGSALAIEDVFRQAGAPEGVFSTLLVSSSKVDRIVSSPVVRAVTLTGSERAGAAVAAAAGKDLKKCVLELGGSDPFLVLADADIEHAAQQAVQSRCINSGQSCIAAKRFIVEQAVRQEFEEALVAEMERLVVGDPQSDATQVGPLARLDLLETLQDQVARSLDAGARRLVGGNRLDRGGFFYQPAVMSAVAPGMAVFDEETFGPVAAVIPVASVNEAVALANQSRFGLGASIWTNDLDVAKRIASQLEAGCVCVNEIVKSDPRLPFGGVKKSGFGRELSEFGLREFVNIKSVLIR